MKLCECGCGKPAPLAKRTNSKRGHVKGQPVRFVYNHHLPNLARRPDRITPPIDRFRSKYRVVSETGCWEWTAYRNAFGYGSFNAGDRMVLAHRWVFEHYVGSIPEGMTLDHQCNNKACVNPDHLKPMPWRDNYDRAPFPNQHARKTHCIRGHRFTTKNTYLRPSGGRRCRACAKITRNAQGSSEPAY